MTGATPGQAAYEAFRSAVPDRVCNVPAGPWDELSPAIRAGFDAIAAQGPHAAEALDERPVIGIAVRALRMIAWGSTPDLKPVDPSVIADKALAELRQLVTDAEVVAEQELFSGAQECHPGREVNLLADDEREQPDCEPGSVDIPSGERDVVEILVPAPHAAPELAVVMAERDDYAARLRAADQSWTRIAVERDNLRERLEAAEAAKRAAKGELAALENRLAQAIAAALMAERARIRELADRSGAVCTGDEGTSHYFSALLTEGPR
jgi:hypothetical protein